MWKKLLPLGLASVLTATGALYAQKRDLGNNISNFASKTGAKVTTSKATGTPGFITISAERTIPLEGGTTTARAAAFLKENAGIYGIRESQDQLITQSTVRDQHGLEHVTVHQHYKGVPVFDGIMKFHYDVRMNLRSVNGNFIPDIMLDPNPSLTREDAESMAFRSVSLQKGVDLRELKVSKNTLYVFRKGLVQGFKGANYLVYEVEVTNEKDVREFLYIDAHTGLVVEQFTGIHGLNRRLYNQTYNPANPDANLLWKEGDEFPGALSTNVWQQSSVATAGHTYHFFKNAFGRTSYNGTDAPMISTHNNPTIDCPNANWNGVSANYCNGTASDDVVAHEWSHAYTEYTSGLVYSWQSGALNESFSDMWGETIDQLNGYMDENESSQTLRQPGCGSSTRWLVAEKATAFGSALRDMWNPNCKGDPGRVGDPLFYCWSDDGGGVHFNSGVPNHAYALLVDGGNYNNYQINGLGLTKSAHIMWRVQTQYLSKTSNFATFGNAMIAAANDLVGAALPALSTLENGASISGEVITLADVAEVQKVVQATELLLESNCGFPPMFAAVDPLCEGSKPASALFFENFENGLANWTVSNTPGSPTAWVNRNWEIKENVYGKPGKTAFGPDPGYGDCTSSTYQHGLLRLESPAIPIPASANGPFMLSFSHLVAMEDLWSGGNIKYQIDNGGWVQVPDAAFVANAYNRSVNTGGLNPLAGQRVFSAGNDGDLKSDWGTSVINLSSLGLTASQTIRLRWELGTSYCTGVEGWYLDDISVYTCASTPAVHFAEAGSTTHEGAPALGSANCLDYSEKLVRVMIDKAPSGPVTLNLSVDPSSTAREGAIHDFTFSPSVVTLDAGNLFRDIVVRVNNDAYPEGPEVIKLKYTLDNNGSDGYAGLENQTHELTINDDDLPPGNSQNVLLSSSFDSGQEGWVIKNGGSDNTSWIRTTLTSGGSPVQLNPNGRPLFFCPGYSSTSATLIDEILESPPFSALGQKDLKLSFRHYFVTLANSSNEQGFVQVWDGTDWQTIQTFCASGCATPGTRGGWNSEPVTFSIPDQYVNPAMKIRFRYLAKNDYYWVVDDIKVTSSNTTTIQTAANAGNGDSQYLGPNETAVFYDPATGGVMAKIKNLSAHDYGCTTVEVDRAGADATPWFGAYQISNKTFKVTPANANPNGKYEITLYYKTGELPNFNGSAVKSMGKSAGGIGTGNQGSTSWAEVQSEAVFDADYSFTATFDSGFSGFGLSDAPPIGSLPVYLAGLTGVATNEGNLLNWSTASEVNSSHFEIEYSPNGKQFEQIGKIDNKGNTVEAQHYSFLDTRHRNGLAYYRLGMVDLDGSFTHSPVISISSKRGNGLKFGPNPVTDVFSVMLPDKKNHSVSLVVVNVTGQKVIDKSAIPVINGTLVFNMNFLPTGYYQAVIEDGGTRHVIPLVKQ